MIGYTHAGMFHADDVFAAALLQLVHPGVEIRRVNSFEEYVLDHTDIVFDIGGRFDGYTFFDHHQGDVGYHTGTEIPFASFGLLWSHFGVNLISQLYGDDFNTLKAWSIVEKDLVIPIDAQDNGVASNPLSCAISRFAHPDLEMDVAFEEALIFACGVLEREIVYAVEKAKNFTRILELLQDQGYPDILEMPEHIIGWQGMLVDTEVKFVLGPSLRGGYNLCTVPSSHEPFAAPKVRFPEAWAEHLPEGCTFCHRAGFLLAADTKEALLQAADLLL